DFDDPEQAKDFYYNRPFQRQGHGSFGIAGGLMRGSGGGGLCTVIAFESDITASAIVRLERPVRDAGLYLRDHRGTLRATLFALRETFFSRKDNQALGLNRIIAIGSVPSAMKGATEFRYVAASGSPEVAEGESVPVTIIREGKVNTMKAHKEDWSGPDVGRPHGDVEIGLFTNGGRAFFDDLLIEGELSESWLRDRRVAMFLSKDIRNAANRLRKKDREALDLAKDFVAGKIPADEVLASLANAKVNVFVREAVSDQLVASDRIGETLAGLKPLLLSKDRGTRTFAGRILDRAIDMDFGFDPDDDKEERAAAVERFLDYNNNRGEREEKGQSFVGGAWRTPEELEGVRLTWEYAREIRTHHFLLRTNMPAEFAKEKAKLLEACYDAFRQHHGREPDPAQMPLRIYLFSENRDFETWCKRN
ncbi:MAG: hypothetical protein GY704_15070, partial [Phycisphaeraceae bacterium]|nr:hypothetical protein [Phycisphaeraceae bacterium]